MAILKTIQTSIICASSLLLLNLSAPIEARPHHSDHGTSAAKHKSGQKHKSSHRSCPAPTAHHGRHHHLAQAATVATKPRYAYPVDMFMATAPGEDHSPLPDDIAQTVRDAFKSGIADNYPPNYLVRAGIATYYPLRGGMFKRREDVRYIIMHSTETGIPQDAHHVVDAWNSMGRRHAGAQYVVDRDGTISNTVNPDIASVHLNVFKTLPGINNDNTIGIEMAHSGGQTYTPEQRIAVIRLVSYLQDRYHVLDENVITHRYAQQGDHTDPVAFDWSGFLSTKDDFRHQAISMKRSGQTPEFASSNLVPSIYIEIHRAIKPEEFLHRKELSKTELPSVSRQATMSKPISAAAQKAVTVQLRGEMSLPPAAADALTRELPGNSSINGRGQNFSAPRSRPPNPNGFQ